MSLGAVSAAPSLGLGGQHFLKLLPVSVSLRYLRVASTTVFPPGYSIGVFAAGKAFRPALGHELGEGRSVVDTGSATRLFGGGFAIDEGVTAGGWQWTMGDLSDAELAQLYQLARDRGQTRSLLVVEDPEYGDGLNERIHWGLLGRLDAYERRDPNLTRWSMSIQDWA